VGRAVRGECVTDGAAAPYREGMRYLAAALVLAACASDPAAPVTDAGADTGPTADLGADAGPRPATWARATRGSTIDTPPVTDAGATGDASDAGAVDTGTDVVRVDGAPCIPACTAGSVCVGGVCEAVDGGADAGTVDGGPPRPTAEAREFQSCEPLGSSCGGDGGVTCVRPDRIPGDAGVRGACLRPCTTGVERDCPEGSRCVPSDGSDNGYCARPCVAGQSACGDAGTLCETSLRDLQRYCL
jgi:hypothetical protein